MGENHKGTGDQLRKPVGPGKKRSAFKAVNHQHADHGIRKNATEVTDVRRSWPVGPENQKRKKPDQDRDASYREDRKQRGAHAFTSFL